MIRPIDRRRACRTVSAAYSECPITHVGVAAGAHRCTLNDTDMSYAVVPHHGPHRCQCGRTWRTALTPTPPAQRPHPRWDGPSGADLAARLDGLYRMVKDLADSQVRMGDGAKAIIETTGIVSDALDRVGRELADINNRLTALEVNRGRNQ